MTNRFRWQFAFLMTVIGLCGSGCASGPYRYGRFHEADYTPSASNIQIEHGRPNKVLDRMAWLVGFPSRILPMSDSVNNHEFSAETEEKLKTYMVENDITDVLIRVNQYDPVGEWRRLRENKRISAGWKYTFGAGGLVAYTLFPGRVFGGDSYNPFTNSMYVNSDLPAMLILEAAYAKDIRNRQLPGPYAAVNELPAFTAWRHTIGVRDTIAYSRLNDDWEIERETYRVVYPILGIHIALGGHSAASFAAPLPILTIPASAIGGAVCGHTAGQTTIAVRERERLRESSQSDDETSPEQAEEDKQDIQMTGATEPLASSQSSIKR